MQISRLSYAAGFYIPQLEVNASALERDMRDNPVLAEERLLLLRNELPHLRQAAAMFSITLPSLDSLSMAHFTPSYADSLQKSLATLRLSLSERSREVSRERNKHLLVLEKEVGGTQALVELKRRYHNNALAEVVLNQNDFDKIYIANGRLVQVKDPVFREPTVHNGRAHFYAPYKMLGKLKIDTLWFNVGVLWLSTALLYLALYFDLLRWVVTQSEKLRLRRVAKRIARIIPS